MILDSMSTSCRKILSATELERYRIRVERTLPAKGKKDFTPTFSWVECKLLDAARNERHELLNEERVERVGALCVAEWDEKENVAVLTYTVGRNWEFFGHQRGEIKCLHPEEALFLLETSNLLLLHNNVGLSVQQAYNTLLGKRTGCSLTCYRVFSHLARQGFRLKRHDGPLYVLTDYERRIGLESYLYPSKHTISTQHSMNVNSSVESGSTECHQTVQASEDISPFLKSESAEPSIVVKRENEDLLSSQAGLTVQNQSDSNIPTVSPVMQEDVTVTVKREHTTASSDIVPQPLADVTVSHFSKNSSSASVKTSKREQQSDLNNTAQKPASGIKVSETTDKSQSLGAVNIKEEHEDSEEVMECDSEVQQTVKVCSSESVQKNETNNTKGDGNNCEIKCEQEIRVNESTVDNLNEGKQSAVSVLNRSNNDRSVNNVIKTEHNTEKDIVKLEDSNSLIDVMSLEDSTDSIIKKEIFIESADSSEMNGSVKGSQQSNKECENRYTRGENLEMLPKETVTVKHEGLGKSVSGSSKNSCAPLVDLTKSRNTNAHNSQIKLDSDCDSIIIGNTPRTMRMDKSSGYKPFHKDIMKCTVNSTDVSSVDNISDVSIDISDTEIVFVSNEGKKARKRPITHQKSRKRSKKSYTVDVDTGAIVKRNKNLAAEKKVKEEQNKEVNEIIIIDDFDAEIDDSDIVIDDSDTSCKNDTVVDIKDEVLEQELTKFYEEITLIDLTNEDSRLESRNEILDLFPNFAGVRIATIKVPPSSLLPENVTPSREEYHIVLQNLCGKESHLPKGRYFNRGNAKQRPFRFRGRPFRRPHFRRSPQNRMPDGRLGGSQQNNREEFFNHYANDHEREMTCHSYGNTFNNQNPDHMPLAMIDTTGAYIPSRRFEHQHRDPTGTPNKQWYGRTFIPNLRNERIAHQRNSPSTSNPHYDRLDFGNDYRERDYRERDYREKDYREGADNHQRRDRRYQRNMNERRNHDGMLQFRNSCSSSSTRSTAFQEPTPQFNWQNFQNVPPNVESWSDLKMAISGRNVTAKNDLIKRESDSLIKSEENENEELELPLEPEDEEMDNEEVEWKPLIGPADCADIGSILEKLRIFKEVRCDPHQIESVDTRLKINYDLYLPTTKFKKSSPCLPDYRICVTESEDEVPTAGEIAVLLKELQDDVPLLFAIVVPDSIAFYHFVNISLPVDDTFSV